MLEKNFNDKALLMTQGSHLYPSNFLLTEYNFEVRTENCKRKHSHD